MKFLLGIWLKEIPEGAVQYCQLTVLGGLIGCLGEGITALLNATGNIKPYQIIINVFNLLGLPIAFFVYKLGYPAESVLIIYCIIAFLSSLLRVILMKSIYRFDVRLLFKVSYSRIFVISVPLIVYYFLYDSSNYSAIGHLCGMICSELFLLLVIVILGTDKSERTLIRKIVSRG